jgi:hypothetical protein
MTINLTLPGREIIEHGIAFPSWCGQIVSILILIGLYILPIIWWKEYRGTSFLLVLCALLFSLIMLETNGWINVVIV